MGAPPPTSAGLDNGCQVLATDIAHCQSLGKKIVLSLGGATGSYELFSQQDAENLADFLWGAFGPVTTAWTNAKKPRPFDVAGPSVTIDGFDFDIENVGGKTRKGETSTLQLLSHATFLWCPQYFLT